MAPFTALPSEILLEIMDLVPPKDLENFAQMSKSVNTLSQSALKVHRELIRKYGTFTSPRDVRRRDNSFIYGAIPTLLRDVLIDPRVGHYIRNFSIRDEMSGDNRLSLYEAVILRQQNTGRFMNCGMALPVLKNVNQTHFSRLLLERMVDCSEDFLLAQLFGLIPNVTSLSLQWNWGMESLTSRMLNYVEPRVLSNLRSVRIDPVDDRWVPLEVLDMLKLNPSLRSLTASRADSRDRISTFTKSQSSNVQELVLFRSEVNMWRLWEFLGSFAKLQTFYLEYDPRSNPPWVRNSFDPFLIRMVLLAQVKTTLQKISLFCKRENQLGIGSLREFELLGELHTDWDILFPENCPLTEAIAQSLPRSIRSLGIRDKRGRDRAQYIGLLNAIRWNKSAILTQLTFVALTLPVTGSSSTSSFEGSAVNHFIGKHAVQSWKQKFKKGGMVLEFL